MQPRTNFFFTCVVNLRDHPFTPAAEEAMFAVHDACRAVDQPGRYGSAIQKIIIDAILQDYPTTFFPPDFSYKRGKKSLEAGVHADVERLVQCDLAGAAQLYQEIIFQVLDRVAPQIQDYDIEGLKRDLAAAIQEEVAAAVK